MRALQACVTELSPASSRPSPTALLPATRPTGCPITPRVSSGSACKTGDPEPSEVLLALGLPREWSLGSLRITVGRTTTDAHVDRLLDVLPGIVDKLRAADRVAA
jgi:hypothetical protein